MSTTRNPEKKQCNNYLNSSVLEFESSCQYDDNNHESNKNPDQWEDRMSKCRERNREHAKKTRLRKKMGLDGMKGRLLELQTEAVQLLQQIEEANTANILLHLGGPSNDQTDTMSDEDLSSSSSSMQPCTLPNVLSNKGNIIDQLRSTIRAETASRISHMLDGRTKVSTLSTNASSSSSPIPFHSSVLSSTTSIEELVAQAHAEAEAAMDDDVDDESVQSGHTDAATSQNNSSSSGSSATSTPSTALSGGIKATENFHSLRKERNRIHAKLTRDRKKLFTTRLQQMINTLERQNSQLRHRLLKSTGTNNQSYPSPIQSVSGTMAAESLLGSAMYRTTSLPSDGGASRYANSWSRIGGSHDGSTDSSNSSSSGDSCSSGLSTSAANDIYLVDRNRRMSV